MTDWIVRAEWVNSSATYYGPFPSPAAASAWADAHLGPDEACLGVEFVLMARVAVAA